MILENQYDEYKNQWEMTRSVVYIVALANSTKKLKPTDVLSFPWDRKTEKIDWNEFNRAKEQMLEDIKNNLNKSRPVTLADL